MKQLIKKLLRENILNSIQENSPAYNKRNSIEAWYKQERDRLDTELEKDKDFKKREIKGKLLFDKRNSLLNQMNKDFKNQDVYGFAGNMDVSVVYHYTTGGSLIGIIEDNELIGGSDEYGGISFTSDGNLYKNKFVFYHATKYSEGTNWKNVGIRMKFNFKLMRQNGLKFKKGNENMGTYSGEYEIRLRQDELPDVKRYLIEIAVFKDKEKNYLTIIEFLKSNNIKHIVI